MNLQSNEHDFTSQNISTDTPSMSPRRYVLLSLAFMVMIIMLTGSMAIYVLADPDLKPILQMTRVAVEVDRLYQRDVNWNELFDSAMNGMLNRLDRYSTYHEPVQFDRISEEMSGSYVGIGVTVIRDDRGLLIMSVRENGPAGEVGLMSGDVVIMVDSVDLTGMTVQESTGLLRGRAGSEVEVEVFRPSTEDTVTVKVTRRQIDFLHIPFAGYTPENMIYIRLLDFDAGASRDLERALDSLLHVSDRQAQGVILDLRGNPGGLFSESYEAANLFLKSGEFIVGTKGRSRWEAEKHYSTGLDITNGLPMAVLVDRGSASSAEIFSGSLQQLGRAILVGDTTFGKGLVQGFNRYLDGSALRLTVSRYYLEGDKYLNAFDSTLHDTGTGLAPDYPFHFMENDAFPLSLEYTLLLNRFANRYGDEIIDASGHFALHVDWVKRFEEFVREDGFVYTSPLHEQAERLLYVAESAPSLPRTREVARTLVDSTAQYDRDVFSQYATYITMRLKELAYERRFGVSQAYEHAIVTDRPDILYATQLLKGRMQ